MAALTQTLVWAPNSASSNESKRVALVVGNSNYQALPRLINPKNDTEAVKNALKESGFHVVVGHDLGRKALEDLIREFLRSHNSESDVSMIYYSGHGVQIAGKNYLVPIDATFKSIYDVETEAVNLDSALQYMKSHSKTQLFFLDACRDNPFRDAKFWVANKLEAIDGRAGLARVSIGLGSLIAFSTEPGSVAADGAGDLSPFTQAFVNQVPKPNVEIRELLTRVRREVIQVTDGRQVPWENSSLIESFFFRPNVGAPVVKPLHQVTVDPDNGDVSLSVPPLRHPSGIPLSIKIESIPDVGKIKLSGVEIRSGQEISPSDFQKLVYSPPKSSTNSVALLSYRAIDSFNQAGQGLVAVKLERSAPSGRQKDQSSNAERAHIGSAKLVDELRRLAVSEVTIGVGPSPIWRGKPTDIAARNVDYVEFSGVPSTGLISIDGKPVGTGHTFPASDISRIEYEPKSGASGILESLTLNLSVAGQKNELKIAIASKVDICDELAGEPLDLQGVAVGTLPNDIQAAAASTACQQAIKRYPQVGRFHFQLGRAELAGGKLNSAWTSFESAGRLGHVRAWVQMAYMYNRGIGRATNTELASELQQKAVAKSDPYAILNVGRSIHRNSTVKQEQDSALQMITWAADLGHTYAINELGSIYLSGRHVNVDKPRAIAFFNLGVKRNDIYSMANLGSALLAGDGVQRDDVAGRALLERAVAGGHPYAPAILGRLFFEGQGVERNPNKAIELFETGAWRGDSAGAFLRGFVSLQQNADRGDRYQIAAAYFGLSLALNPKDPLGAKALLASISDVEKRKATVAFAKEIKPGNKLVGNVDEVLIASALAVWKKRNPRHDLF